MFRRISITVGVLFLTIAGSVATTGTSQAEINKGGLYGSAHSCYNAINNSADLKAHRSFCFHNFSTVAWEVHQWEVGDAAAYYGGQYGRLDGCYNGIFGDELSENLFGFCNFGSDKVYHIYFAVGHV